MKSPKTTNTRLVTLSAAALLCVLGGCTPRDAEVAESEIDTIGGRLADAMGRPLPDTTGMSVWLYLERVDYRNAWARWPGLGEFYGGSEPHGLLLTTYVNSAAHEAADAYSGEMPVGALVVKEAYLPTRDTLDNVTVMYKVEGYNPEHEDWFFAKYLPDGTIEAEGRVEACQECHMEGPDYIRTAGFDAAADGG